jgi:hypothetical protein
MLYLAIVLSLGMGGVVGLLGGGGSILTIPILVYVLGMDPKAAIATSLLVVNVTSLIGVSMHARAGAVRWRVGLVFGAVSMVGAYAAGRVAKFVPDWALLLLFASLLAVTAILMLRKNPSPVHAQSDSGAPSAMMVAGQGLGVGALTGLVGAGGGFLIVPSLVFLTRLSMHNAVATSLLVIVLNTSAAFAGYASHAPVNYAIAALVAACAAGGAVLGAFWAHRIAQNTLRRAFAWFVLVMSGFLFYRQIPEEWIQAMVG